MPEETTPRRGAQFKPSVVDRPRAAVYNSTGKDDKIVVDDRSSLSLYGVSSSGLQRRGRGNVFQRAKCKDNRARTGVKLSAVIFDIFERSAARE